MHWQSCPYVLPFAIETLFVAVVAMVAWRRRPAAGATAIAVALIAMTQWSAASALQWGSADLSGQLFWFKARFLGTEVTAVGMLLFAIAYRERSRLTRRRIAALSLMPLISLALLWTNQWHRWFFRDAWLDQDGSFAALIVQFGPWFWVHAAYDYAMVTVALLLLVQAVLSSPRVYRAQVIAVSVAGVVPVSANAITLAGLSPIPHLDLTPFAFSISAIALVAGFLRFKLADLAPAARDAVIEGMTDAMFILDERDRIVDLNPAAQGLVKQTASSTLGVKIDRVLPACSDLLSHGGDSARSGDTEIALPVGGSDGQTATRNFALGVSPVRGKSGEVTGRVLLLHDITEQAQTRERLRQSEESYRTILENIEDGYYEIDLFGNFITLTEVTARIAGVPREESIGRNFAELTDVASAKELFRIYNSVYVSGAPVKDLEYRIRTPGGVTKSLEASASLMRDATGRPIGFRGIVRDVSERKRAEAELRQAKSAAEEASRAKGAFLATVSHELRTPLTSVVGFAKLIKKRLGEVIMPAVAGTDAKVERAARQVSDNVEIIISEGERLTALINDVLDLAKIESGRVEWHMQSVAVADMIERAIAATASLVEHQRLPLRTDIQSPLPNVVADQDRLLQVVINLISNAVKFTTDGAVTCRAQRTGDTITVSVTDTGIGIAPEDREKVFEQFVQVGDTLTGKPTGTGLGLPICKQIIEHHGGRIWVESIVGQGTTVSFTLPIDRPAMLDGGTVAPLRIELGQLVEQLRQRVAALEPADDEPRTVLIVDDDQSIRSLLRQELEAAGYAVREVCSGEEALAAVKQQRPGLIILDVMMPGLSGFDVTAVLRNDPQTLDIPIVILSVIQDRERGLRLGVDHYFTKPVSTDALLHEVEALLARGPSKKKVLVVDEDAATVRTLSDALQAQGYSVMSADSGPDAIARAVADQPDLVLVRSLLSEQHRLVQTLRFNKGMQAVSFLLFE